MTLLDWTRLYGEVFPKIPAGAFFDRLSTESVSFVLVTGCQRSGTTWFSKLLGSCLDDAHTSKELEVCNYLINNHDIPLHGVSTLVLQTTFINTEIESYARLSEEIPVIAIARNPFSVCWSLVNNWDNLSLEYARRCGTKYDPCRVHTEKELWRMALHIYKESTEATIAILRGRPSCTRLLIYDELIRDVPAALSGISVFLRRKLVARSTAPGVDLMPSAKHESMPGQYRELIASECSPIFSRLNGMYAPPHSGKMSPSHRNVI